MTPRWWRLGRGDIDTTIANAGFNLAQVIIPIFLLAPVGIPREFGIRHLLPGYALGYLVGSLGFLALGVRLAKRESRTDVTAHIYGNNVPAILSYTLAIIAPVYLQTHDAFAAWRMGSAAVLWTGIVKLTAAPFAGWIRRAIPVAASMTVFSAAMYSFLGMVLMQRIFDQPFIGLVALAIVAMTVLARLPITPWRLPPFLVAWMVPLALGIAIGYVHPAWQSLAPGPPWAAAEPWRALVPVLPYLSVIVPISCYEVLQDIAATEGAAAAGDNYDARAVVACDGLGTLICGLAGSVVCPVVYAMHPSYKAMGARLSFALWTPLSVLLVISAGLTMWVSQLFPWSILAAMVAYVSVGVGMATLNRVERKYHAVVLLGFLLPAGAVVSSAVNSALPAVGLSETNAAVQTALNRSIYWSSVQGLGNGFLLLVLVFAAIVTELIDHRFGRAAVWCGLAAAFSWVGLMHSAVARWGAQPVYAAGWLAAAGLIYSARWWGGKVTGEVPAAQPASRGEAVKRASP
jgi:AGZA family xanthine/uracil permease-like MFS transporter